MAETAADPQEPATPLVDYSTRRVQHHLDSVTSELADQDGMSAGVVSASATPDCRC